MTQKENPTPTLEEPEDESLSLLGEFLVFLKENKKWWLIPLILMIAGVGLLVLAGSGSALAPFIYTLF